jgi:hypothetical protein
MDLALIDVAILCRLECTRLLCVVCALRSPLNFGAPLRSCRWMKRSIGVIPVLFYFLELLAPFPTFSVFVWCCCFRRMALQNGTAIEKP